MIYHDGFSYVNLSSAEIFKKPIDGKWKTALTRKVLYINVAVFILLEIQLALTFSKLALTSLVHTEIWAKTRVFG